MPVGDLIIIFGFMLVVYTWAQTRQRRGGAPGVISEIRYGSSRAGVRKSHHPVITFTVDGRDYTFTPSIITILDTRQNNVGAPVTVAFNPANPTEAELAAPWRLYAPPVLLTALFAAAVYIRFS
jgi:hypothetical protein